MMKSTGLHFIKDRKYRVRRDFSSRMCVIFSSGEFKAGEIVVFCSRSYSPYDGLTELYFKKLATGRNAMWTISDSENIDISQTAFELFEDVAANEEVYAASLPARCFPDKHDWELCFSYQHYEFYACRTCGSEKCRNLQTETESFVQ